MIRSTTRLSALAAVVMLAAPALAAPVNVDVTNGSTRDLTGLFAAAAGSDAWGDDLLGGGFLPAGNTAAVPVGDDGAGCSYDLRFVFASGDPVEVMGRDLCADSAVTVTD